MRKKGADPQTRYTYFPQHVAASSHPAFTAAGQSSRRIGHIHAPSQPIHVPSYPQISSPMYWLGSIRGKSLCLNAMFGKEIARHVAIMTPR